MPPNSRSSGAAKIYEKELRRIKYSIRAATLTNCCNLSPELDGGSRDRFLTSSLTSSSFLDSSCCRCSLSDLRMEMVSSLLDGSCCRCSLSHLRMEMVSSLSRVISRSASSWSLVSASSCLTLGAAHNGTSQMITSDN